MAKQYAAVQEPILTEAQSCFLENEVQALRTVVRLAVEFDDYLRREDIDALDPDELEYVAGSVFAGIESFMTVAHGYSVLSGSTHSTIQWPILPLLTSPGALKVRYLAMYQAFEALDVKAHFEEKLCVALDLFKLQLLFVSVLYNW